MTGDRAAAYPLGAAATIEALEGDPHPLLARLREREPVSWLPALGGWVITRRDLALAAMRDADAFTVDDPRFSTAQVVGPSMLSTDGAAHARHRAPFARPFRRDAVRERFTDWVAAEAERLLGALPAGEPVELRRAFAGPLAAGVVGRALGLHADTAAVLAWYDAIVAAVTGVTAGRPVSEAGRGAFASLRDALLEAMDREASASLLAAAVAGAGAGGLGRDEVVANAAVLLFGGIETTEGMIANTVAHLVADPAALARVRGDPALVAGAVEESLRLEPAAATIDRYATREVELGGAAIRRGELVVISIAAANRDPATFPDPDRFDPERANARLHLAFAHGPHVCVGMHLARLEAHAALEALLRRMPALRAVPGRPAAARGLVFRKPPALWVAG